MLTDIVDAMFHFYVRVMEAASVLHRLSVDLLPLSGFVSARQAPLEFATT